MEAVPWFILCGFFVFIVFIILFFVVIVVFLFTMKNR